MSPGTTAQAIVLERDLFIQHGHGIELKGKTEKGARVMENGSEVPMVNSDRQFHYFTPPLPPGEAMISATAQRAQGGVNTPQKKIVIQLRKRAHKEASETRDDSSANTPLGRGARRGLSAGKAPASG